MTPERAERIIAEIGVPDGIAYRCKHVDGGTEISVRMKIVGPEGETLRIFGGGNRITDELFQYERCGEENVVKRSYLELIDCVGRTMRSWCKKKGWTGSGPPMAEDGILWQRAGLTQ